MKNILVFIILIVSNSGLAQKNIILKSPDGNIAYHFQMVKGKATFQVSLKGKSIVERSQIGFEFADGTFSENLKMGRPLYRDTTEDYELLVGKARFVKESYNEVSIPLLQLVFPHRQVNIVVRVFNDGVAFRYEFPAQGSSGDLNLLDENTSFNLNGNPTVHALFLMNYVTSHEGLYTSLPLKEVKEDTLMDMPALFTFPGGIHLAISEAALLNYSGMYLSKHNGILRSKLSPLPNQSDIKVKLNLPHNSPWRVLLISDRIGALIESNIITTLNKPTSIKDLSWVKPGKTTWTWWNGNISPDTSFSPGNNFEFNKYYIDFCADNGIEYHSVVEYGNKEWYVNDGIGFVPGSKVDVTKPVPGLDMQQICDYAKTKGVGIRVWVHWQALFPQPRLDSAFAVFERWGIKGLMVDFMDRDDQEMVNIQTEILEKAALHRLHIQFHGSYKPTGLSRTYPNELTRESALNYEANKWVPGGVPPDHDIYIPFTRMIAGPVDYHLGGFRAVAPSKFKVQFTRPLMLGTRCHMLAMYVVLESYLGLVSDYPQAYVTQPGFDFITKVPTTWDETKVLAAEVNKFITVARRKNQDWYIGTITNSQERQLTIQLDFLPEGAFVAQIFKDAPNAGQYPNNLVMEDKIVKADSSITIKLAAGGGHVVYLRRQ